MSVSLSSCSKLNSPSSHTHFPHSHPTLLTVALLTVILLFSQTHSPVPTSHTPPLTLPSSQSQSLYSYTRPHHNHLHLITKQTPFPSHIHPPSSFWAVSKVPNFLCAIYGIFCCCLFCKLRTKNVRKKSKIEIIK